MGNGLSLSKKKQPPQKKYTLEEIRKEKKASICLVSIFGNVYNVAKYLPEHPGGENILRRASGDILDDVFTDGYHRHLGKRVHNILAPYQVGTLVEENTNGSSSTEKITASLSK